MTLRLGLSHNLHQWWFTDSIMGMTEMTRDDQRIPILSQGIDGILREHSVVGLTPEDVVSAGKKGIVSSDREAWAILEKELGINEPDLADQAWRKFSLSLPPGVPEIIERIDASHLVPQERVSRVIDAVLFYLAHPTEDLAVDPVSESRSVAREDYRAFNARLVEFAKDVRYWDPNGVIPDPLPLIEELQSALKGNVDIGDLNPEPVRYLYTKHALYAVRLPGGHVLAGPRQRLSYRPNIDPNWGAKPSLAVTNPQACGELTDFMCMNLPGMVAAEIEKQIAVMLWERIDQFISKLAQYHEQKVET